MEESNYSSITRRDGLSHNVIKSENEIIVNIYDSDGELLLITACSTDDMLDAEVDDMITELRKEGSSELLVQLAQRHPTEINLSLMNFEDELDDVVVH